MDQSSDWTGLWSAVVGGASGGLVSFMCWGFKGRRDDLDKIVDLFNDMRAESSIYWGCGGIDVELERSIVRMVQRVSGKCYAYSRNYLSAAQSLRVRSAIQAMNILVTGGNFGSVARLKDLGRISGISLQIDRVCEDLAIEWVWGTIGRLRRFGR